MRRIPGLTIATGMSGHGFGIGPGMGRVVADLVLGTATGPRPVPLPPVAVQRRQPASSPGQASEAVSRNGCRIASLVESPDQGLSRGRASDLDLVGREVDA